MDEKSQRIHDYSSRLARSILIEVVDDIKLGKATTTTTTASVKQENNKPKSSPRLIPRHNGQHHTNGDNKLRKRKTAREEAEIDLLADRLTSDIISHATYNGKKLRKNFDLK